MIVASIQKSVTVVKINSQILFEKILQAYFRAWNNNTKKMKQKTSSIFTQVWFVIIICKFNIIHLNDF